MDLLLGTEQALMLHSISTNILFHAFLMLLFMVINVYLVAFAEVGVGHLDQRAQWQSCMSCACNGSQVIQNSILTHQHAIIIP